MYQFFSEISNLLSKPLINIGLQTMSVPILSAFILGIVGAVSPCQFTGNLGAITVYGNQSLQKSVAWKGVFYFILGKIVVFSGLGLLIWFVGNELKETLMLYFPWIRRVVGPILIIIGLFMLGLVKFTRVISFSIFREKFERKGSLGAFLIGVSFTLGFCPTMFTLFFVTLMPMATAVSYGAILPVFFALGTSLPVVLAIFLIWYFELGGTFVKKSGRRIGHVVQKLAGILLLVLGVLDTLTYWAF
ncbi:urease accessory protein UreH domain-containing protein [Robertmurraya massiliosenegalensis]|uniref:urease accessory protein UreH domain-containing protein n=1 Tax=Robertmurraya massiliosenegalensis TaxID=1287657 RepID=UPI0003110754|nr:sulfite exporter TauE/SafE family protein [Robertmurraya massiliosenegalensis]